VLFQGAKLRELTQLQKLFNELWRKTVYAKYYNLCKLYQLSPEAS
jgi:hypothetical protein